jgi:hypothetical protein
LTEAKLNDVYNPIREATYGIAFFATPHRGGSHAKLGDIAASVAKGMLRTPDNTFMEALKKDSMFAEGITEDFRHQLEDFAVLSFYETLPYKKIGLVCCEDLTLIILVLMPLDRRQAICHTRPL